MVKVRDKVLVVAVYNERKWIQNPTSCENLCVCVLIKIIQTLTLTRLHKYKDIKNKG